MSNAFSTYTPSELINALMNLDQNPELKESISNSIPRIEQQGVVVVDPEFKQHILDFDPIQTAEILVKKLDVADKEKAMLSNSLILLHLSSAYKQIITEESFDFSDRSSWEDYIKGIESLGFEQVLSYEKKRKDKNEIDEEIAFWNKEHSILWLLNSYTLIKKSVNASNIYFYGEKRNPKTICYLPINRGFSGSSEIQKLSCDMRTMPTHYFFELLKEFKPCKYWADCSIYFGDFTEHAKELPDYVRSCMFDYNFIRKINNFEKSISTNKYHEFQKRGLDFVESLNEIEKKYIFTWNRLFSISRHKNGFFPLSLKVKLKETFEDFELDYAIGMINEMLYKAFDRDFNFTDFALEHFSTDEKDGWLKIIEKEVARSGGYRCRIIVSDEQYKKLKSDLLQNA